MVPKENDKGKVKFVCRKCGWTGKSNKLKIVNSNPKKEKLFFVKEKDDNDMPTIKEKCPECGHNKAYYFLIQTRAADEPATKFFKCVECGHKWREYN